MSETSSVPPKAGETGNKNSGLSTTVITGEKKGSGLVIDDFYRDVEAAHKMFPNIRNPMYALELYMSRMHPETLENMSEDEEYHEPVQKRSFKRAPSKPVEVLHEEEEIDDCEEEDPDPDCPFWMKDVDQWINEDNFDAAEEVPFEYSLTVPFGKERSHHCQ